MYVILYMLSCAFAYKWYTKSTTDKPYCHALQSIFKIHIMYYIQNNFVPDFIYWNHPVINILPNLILVHDFPIELLDDNIGEVTIFINFFFINIYIMAIRFRRSYCSIWTLWILQF